MKRPQAHTLFISFLLVAAVANAVVAVSLYRRSTVTKILPSQKDSQVSSPAGSRSIDNDLKALLQSTPVARASYAVIGDKNLFNAKRTAWKPPVKNLDSTQEDVAPKSRRRDVVLCGIFRIGDKKGAILEFPALNSKRRKRTMYVGDTATSDLNQRSQIYVLERIAKDSVTVKDYKGVVFSVPLYDGKKNKRRATVAAKTSVTVDATTAPAQKSAVASVRTGGAAEAQKIAKQREASARLEQKVKQGTLKKVQTPFGTAYLKNNKPATME